jgi:uncharacterized protein YdcH (DUF465 family)
MNEQSQDEHAQSPQIDDEYDRLTHQHHQLEDRLHELTARAYLSEPEQLEEATIKKQKLALKDRMESLAHQHRPAARH